MEIAEMRHSGLWIMESSDYGCSGRSMDLDLLDGGLRQRQIALVIWAPPARLFWPLSFCLPQGKERSCSRHPWRWTLVIFLSLHYKLSLFNPVKATMYTDAKFLMETHDNCKTYFNMNLHKPNGNQRLKIKAKSCDFNKEKCGKKCGITTCITEKFYYIYI